MAEFKISKKERNLMINSESPKVFPWFYELLMQKEKLNIKDIPEKYHSDFKHVIPHLLKQCGEEWKNDESILHPVEDLGGKRKKCSLCGTPNRFIFYITNRLNGKKLNVGKDCVEEFADIDLLKNGKSKNQLIKEAIRIKRRSIINKRFPNLDNELDRWGNLLDNYNVLIPNQLAKPYERLGQDIRKLFNDFLDGKGDESTIRKIRRMLKQRDKFINEMNVYNENHKDDKFIATVQMKKKLLKDEDLATLERLQETGRVDETSISKVIEPFFLERIFEDVKSLFAQIEVDIKQFPPEPDYFLLTPKMHNGSIKFLCKQEKIFVNFGSLFFGKSSKAAFTVKNLVKISDFFDSASVANFISELNYLSRRTGIKLNQTFEDEIDIEYENKILPYSLKDFLRDFKAEIFDTNFNVEAYVKLIKTLDGKRYTRDELNDIRGVKSSMSSRYRSLEEEE
jgi:hypothetical protein